MSMTARIPRDYTELFRFYSAFIANEIRKKNTVAMNFEDAYQAVCCKLIEAKVIEKFHARCSEEVPDTMTLAEAIDTLGTTHAKWRSNQSNYRYRGGLWMPDAINGAAPSSKKAVFKTSDILRIDEVHRRWCDRAPVVSPTRTLEPTPYQFMNYLGMAIRNHFNNFCRTRARKWQDSLGDQAYAKRTPRKGSKVEPVVVTARPTHGSAHDPQFHTADGAYNTFWTDTIRDDHTESGMEARVELARVLNRLAARVPEEKHQAEILDGIQEGYTLIEAIKRTSLPSNRKRVLTRVFA